MFINKTFETKKGQVQFKGELTDNELQFLVEVGLTTLYEEGYLPFMTETDERQLAFDFSEEKQ